HGECIVCFNRDLSAHPISHSTARLNPTPNEGIDIGDFSNGQNNPTGLDVFDTRKGPEVPQDTNQKKRITVGGSVQQAMLVRRVEPSYPTIAKQLGRSGSVHIRALISTEGNIQSLQLIDGDPLLVKSALDAVGQWRYRPTMLNGQ